MREYKEYLRGNSRQTHTRHRRGGRRLLALVLCLCMAAAASPLPAAANTVETKNGGGVSESSIGLLAEETSTAWDGKVADEFAGGRGTSDAPYQIATAAQLAYLAQILVDSTQKENVYYKLTADIDLNDQSWTLIEGGTAFNGNFDGNNHTISGLNGNKANAQNSSSYMYYIGLFGNCDGATIRDLTVIGKIDANGNAEQKSEVYAGGICGHAVKTTFQNCSSQVNVSVSYTGDDCYVYAGGICGYSGSGCSFTACSNRGNITASGSEAIVGGIAAAQFSPPFIGCYNQGSLSGTGTGKTYVGGIACCTDDDSKTSGCVYLGSCISNIAPESIKSGGQSMTQEQINSGAAAGYMNNALTNTDYRWCQDLSESADHKLYVTKKTAGSEASDPDNTVYPTTPCPLGTGSNSNSTSFEHGSSLIYTEDETEIPKNVKVGCACGASDASDYGTLTLALPTSYENKNNIPTYTYDGAAKEVTVNTSKITNDDVREKVNAAVTESAVSYKKNDGTGYGTPSTVAPTDAGIYQAEFTLRGADNKPATLQTYFQISQAATTLTLPNTPVTKTFGDQPFSLGVSVEPSNAEVTYEVQETDPCVSVSENGVVTIKGAGTATVNVSVTATENYTAASGTVTIKVGKKSGYTASVSDQSVEVGTTNGEVDLSEYLPSDCGEVTYDTPVTSGALQITSAAVLSDGKLSYTLNGGAAGDTGMVSVKVTTDNYADFALSVPIKLTAKPDSGSSSGGGYSGGITPAKPAEDNKNKEPQIRGENGATGWGAILDAIRAAKSGDTITIQMNGVLTVPGKVLKSLRGKNVNVVFEMNEKLALTINGRDLRGFTFKNKNEYHVLFLWSVGSMVRLIQSIGA